MAGWSFLEEEDEGDGVGGDWERRGRKGEEAKVIWATSFFFPSHASVQIGESDRSVDCDVEMDVKKSLVSGRTLLSVTQDRFVSLVMKSESSFLRLSSKALSGYH